MLVFEEAAIMATSTISAINQLFEPIMAASFYILAAILVINILKN